MDERLPGSRQAEKLLTSAEGATMDELIAATGGPQYNLLRRLEAQGYKIRKVKEGRATRYRAIAPSRGSFEMQVSRKGQVTLPREIREKLGVGRGGGRLQGSIEGNRLVIANGGGIEDLFRILPKPGRPRSLEEIDQGIAEGATRQVGRRKAPWR
jgi:bifunctional DNA-binding transcriptional regulator/antitoxin component of YhaV-PrlF toxin-antitoxin module